jgi:IS4 transposase
VDKGKETRKIYFASDLKMLATDIFDYYRSRFQIEFVYRDGKQFTGLEHCLARRKIY